MDEGAASRRPTKLVLAGVGLFIVAVVLGRLLVAGGALWVLFALVLPIVLLVLAAAVGWRTGFVFLVVFTVAVLAIRWLLRNNPAGWVALMLLPVVALTAMLVGKVLAQLRRDAKARRQGTTGDESTASDSPTLAEDPSP